MWSSIIAVLIAASACVGLFSFSVHAKRTQEALNQLPDRAAYMLIDRPAQSKKDSSIPGTGAPTREDGNV